MGSVRGRGGLWEGSPGCQNLVLGGAPGRSGAAKDSGPLGLGLGPGLDWTWLG